MYNPLMGRHMNRQPWWHVRGYYLGNYSFLAVGSSDRKSMLRTVSKGFGSTIQGRLNMYGAFFGAPTNFNEPYSANQQVSGETSATKEGKDAHREFGPGTKLGASGPITDRLDAETNTVNELKPDKRLDDPSKYKQAVNQLESQMTALRASVGPEKTIHGILWGWCKEGGEFVFRQRHSILWAGKRIPGVAIGAVGLGYADDVQNKGFTGGTVNSVMDATPVLGTFKGFIELGTGDWIPNTPTCCEETNDSPSSPPDNYPPPTQAELDAEALSLEQGAWAGEYPGSTGDGEPGIDSSSDGDPGLGWRD
jgi:hypothetical protein